MMPTPSAGRVLTPVVISVTMTVNHTVASTESIRRSIADVYKNARWLLIGLFFTRLPYGHPRQPGQPVTGRLRWGLSPVETCAVVRTPRRRRGRRAALSLRRRSRKRPAGRRLRAEHARL